MMQLIVRTRCLYAEVSAEALFLEHYAGSTHTFWLDSSRAVPGLSRFSFLGAADDGLSEILTYDASQKLVTVERGEDDRQIVSCDLFEYLNEIIDARSVANPGLPFDFCGGYVGYFGYEVKQDCGASNSHIASTHDAAFLYVDKFVAIDHELHQTWLVHIGTAQQAGAAANWMDGTEHKIAQLKPLLAAVTPDEGTAPTFRLRHGHSEYTNLIRDCLKDIRNGETYEVCLTNLVTSECQPDPVLLYRVLRSINPAPYAAYLKLPAVTILCSSPERFLKIDPFGSIEAKPIKGTRARGKTESEDENLKESLRSSEKDQAENLMIVDLLRNDIGKISRTGSVKVSKLMDIETYATVHQMVSTIRGQLAEGVSAVDAIRASFPGGSMTGAPKHRTMAIIDKLEAGPRGIYSGAIGFLSLNGAVDLNIVIRTIVLDQSGLSIGCGGAIIALSDAEDEYDEILLKARAPMRAVALAVGGGISEAFVFDIPTTHPARI